MADDGFSVEVNTVAFEGAMQTLKKAVRDGIISPEYGTLPVQARLLAERCQVLTPPRNVGQGNVAVMRDLTRIYFPQSVKTYCNKGVRSIVAGDKRDAWNAEAKHFSQARGLRGTTAVAFDVGLHKRYRNRCGRVSSPRKSNFGMVTLGPQAALARAYMKQVKARVGWARGGWNKGITMFGGTVTTGWINRHGTARGRASMGSNLNEPWVAVANDTGWAKYNGPDGERIIRNAIQARARDMEKYVERMMHVAAGKANKRAS